jgi:DNA-binding transcriptional LysR family regulator
MMQETSTSTPDAPRTLSLDALRTFLVISETGSFRRASARVHRSPSAVSLQIANLEDILGVRLFHRNARRVTLTEDGDALLAHARRLVELNDEALAQFRKPAVSGRITLAAAHDLGVSLVPGLLRRLAAVYPDLRVDVRLGSGAAVREVIASGDVNLVLFNEVGPDTLGAQDLISEPLVWLMREGGGAIRQSPLPLAIAEVGCAWRDAALGCLDAAGLKYRIAYASDTSMGQVAALRADLAIAALPHSLAGDGLVKAPPHYRLPSLPHNTVRAATDGGELAKLALSLFAGDADSPALPAAS